MFFWKRLHNYSQIVYRARKHPAFLLCQDGRYSWRITLDPAAPVDHHQLLYALDLGEEWNLFQQPFRDPKQAKKTLCAALEYSGQEQRRYSTSV